MITSSSIPLLYAARALRGFGDGFAVILLPVYLSALGYGPVEVGIVATAALLGSGAPTLGGGVLAARYPLPNLLLLGAILMAATGVALPAFQPIALFAIVAFIRDINPPGGEPGGCIPVRA